ncbi:MAG: hypothetical protein SFU98_15055 [Leptospiraceae bacterium]|nr:hypothetical protein [Leptospiraceae bacterium]
MNKFQKKILLLLLILVISLFFIKPNLDLSTNSSFLFMDELISFDGVKKILHPKDLEDFFFQIMDGDDHRYGRILWNYLATVSFIPERIWGEQGQIFISRIAQYFLLIASVYLLGNKFISNFYLRVLFIFLIIVAPFTVYFSTMPKPEPIQIFCISLFLITKTQRNLYPWFFLGLAFGSKISTLTILPVITLHYLLDKNFLKHKLLKQIYMIIGITFFFLQGLFVAVPILAQGKFTLYIDSTFKNTTHGSDDAMVSVWSWIDFILNSFFGIPKSLVIAFAFYIALIFLIYLYRSRYSLKGLLESDGALMYLIGISSLLPIILTVKRLWGLYLYPSYFFIILGVLIILDRETKRVWKQILMIFSVVLVLFVYFRIPIVAGEIETLSTRTKHPLHIRKENEYRMIQSFLDKESNQIKRRLKVYLDPDLYRIHSNQYYQVDNFWGYFLQWNENPDYIFYYKTHLVEELPKVTNALYQEAILAKKQLEEHQLKNGTCITRPCYEGKFWTEDLYFLRRLE